MKSTTDHELTRDQFEKWISAPPYEYSVARWPMDETKHSWPCQYQDINVQLAWKAWCASAESHLEWGVADDPKPKGISLRIIILLIGILSALIATILRTIRLDSLP